MVLDRVFDRSGLPDTADRDRERPHVLDMIVPDTRQHAGRGAPCFTLGSLHPPPKKTTT